MNNMSQLKVELPDAMHQKIKVIAAKRGVTVRLLIMQFIRGLTASAGAGASSGSNSSNSNN